jgi:hypothetical protein
MPLPLRQDAHCPLHVANRDAESKLISCRQIVCNQSVRVHRIDAGSADALVLCIGHRYLAAVVVPNPLYCYCYRVQVVCNHVHLADWEIPEDPSMYMRVCVLDWLG